MAIPGMLYFATLIHKPDADWVTFIHGAGGNSKLWFKQISDFNKRYNLLLIDLRGHGNSISNDLKPLDHFTFEKIGDEVLEVLDHLKIRKTHWLGISLGTIIIREIAQNHPDRVSSMIMGGAIMKINLSGQVFMHLSSMIKSIIPYIYLCRIFAWIIMPRPNHRESRSVFLREVLKLQQADFIKWFDMTSGINPLLRKYRMNDLGIPTLYIMGSEDYMFLSAIKKLAKDHNSAQLHIIPSCGHVVNIEQPEIFNTSALRFISSPE